MAFIIRKMKKEDTKQVQDVAKKCWKSTYNQIIPRNIQESFLKAAYSDEMVERRRQESFIFVAEMENDVVGFANFTPVNDEGQSKLGAIYIHPNSQNKGIGTALLQKGIEQLVGVREIYIDVEKDNNIGKTFYNTKGFKTIKEYNDNFEGHILKTVQMCLTV